MPYATSQAKVERLLSAVGVDLRTDDLNNSGQLWADLLSYVDAQIKKYTNHHYVWDDIVGNAWISGIATRLVANELSKRRGNKPIFSQDVARIYEQLQDIRLGNDWIPDAKTMVQEIPSVRNYNPQLNDPRQPLRVDIPTSTGGDYPGEPKSSWPDFGY